MLTLSDRSWQSIYESRPQADGAYLVDEFYVPALERSIQYDRIAGYFSSSALAVASQGIDALLENDGEMRLVVGTKLYTTDRPIFEALTDDLYTQTRFGQRFSVCMTNGAYERKSLALSHAHA